MNMDSSRLTGAVFLDLSKAFDTVDHNHLLHRLKSVGLSDEVKAISRACETEPRVFSWEPQKIPVKKFKNVHSALIWYLLHASTVLL